MELKDKVVVVTGGARGIGRQIAIAFAERGARIALVDILDDTLKATAMELRRTGKEVLPLNVDVTEPSQVELMAARVEREMGDVDVLVNNAGTFSVIAALWESEPGRWFRDIRVGVFGTYLCCRAFVGGMVKRRSGYIINVISTAGAEHHPYSTSYSCAKAGVIRMTEDLAFELKECGVKVFGLMPGTVLTEMTRFIMNDPGGKKYRPNFAEEFKDGKDDAPEKAAELAVDLVSGRADRLTGRNFWAPVGLEKTLKDEEQILRDDLLVVRFREPKSSV